MNNKLNLIITDIESTGLDHVKNGLCSIGAVEWNSGETFYGECWVDKSKEISPKALEINGFTLEDLYDMNKLSPYKLVDRFVKWCLRFNNKPILGGHQVGSFDALFIKEYLETWPFSYRYVDLHSIAFAKFKESLSHDSICDKLGLPRESKPHHALKGAQSENDCLKILLK